MLDINLYKLQYTGIRCSNKDCKKLPESVINILGSVYYIKIDTVVADIGIRGTNEIYCHDCIPEVYKYIKSKLDPKFWAFH